MQILWDLEGNDYVKVEKNNILHSIGVGTGGAKGAMAPTEF